MVESNRVEVSTGLLSAVADPIRWQLIGQLSADDTRCVCQFRTEPEIPANLLSYHLKVLRAAGLLTSERRASWVYYAVVPEALREIAALLDLNTAALAGVPA